MKSQLQPMKGGGASPDLFGHSVVEDPWCGFEGADAIQGSYSSMLMEKKVMQTCKPS